MGGMASPSTTTLVLAETALPAASLPPGCASQSWEYARDGGFRSFHRYSRFLGFPVRLSAEGVGSPREPMLLTFRGRLEHGARGVLLVPPLADDAAAAAGVVERTSHAAEVVARMRVVAHVPAAGSRAEPRPSCPPRVAAAVPETPPAYRLEAVGGAGLPLDEPDPAEALVEHGDPMGGPLAVAGLCGAGAWLLLPAPGAAGPEPSRAAVEECLGLFTDLDSLVEAHDRAARRVTGRGTAGASGSPGALRASLEREGRAGTALDW